MSAFVFARASYAAIPANLHIDADQPAVALPPNFSGLMTEEINHSYDGGLFAELIQNRTFQDPGSRGDIPIHWSAVGSAKVSEDSVNPVTSALPVSLRLDLSGGAGGVANDGFWGIPVKPNTTYTARFFARASGFAGPVTAALVVDDGNVTVAQADSQPVSGAWRNYTVKLTTGADAPTTANAHFVLSANGTGTLFFSLVSLFPPTYENTHDGLRPDLMKLMADLHPRFIRLPGGNYLEGNTFATRFNWKQMIGPADQRPGHMGCWGYRSSDGFGLPQYLLWCKQLGAEPVLALFAGYVLNGDHVDAGSAAMAQYTQEALEEIEYVSGPADSTWGQRRAADGFREPIPLHFVEIGNEDWFDKSGSYDGRFAEMAKAIRARYPKLKIIATAPVKTVKPDLYDDHYYRSARQLMIQAREYDKSAASAGPMMFAGGSWSGRQPEGIQTFVGEWATQEGRPTPDLNAALSDTAFLLGLEQNADTIAMESYAPLLVNVSPADPAKGYPKAWQWPTNLIGYDALRSFGSPSYYAQAMLGQNKGNEILKSSLEVAPIVVATQPTPHGYVGVGTWHTQVQYSDIVVTAPGGETLLKADLSKDTHGWQFTGGKWDLQDRAITPALADSESWAITGNRNWTDYTIRLRARKIAGREGFIVIWHATDGDNYNWWNVGGWGDTMTRCEAAEEGARDAYGPRSDFKVETGRWYDLRVEITGRRMRGFVDGKLVTDATQEPHPAVTPVFASAAYADQDHAIILRVVNIAKDPVDMAINIQGAGSIRPTAPVTVLTGQPRAVNTVDHPTNVVPRHESMNNASSSFHYTFLPHSFTLMRLTASAVNVSSR